MIWGKSIHLLDCFLNAVQRKWLSVESFGGLSLDRLVVRVGGMGTDVRKDVKCLLFDLDGTLYDPTHLFKDIRKHIDGESQ